MYSIVHVINAFCNPLSNSIKIFCRSLLFFLILGPANADNSQEHNPLKSWVNHLHQLWQNGDPELYMTGYAWHNRYTYERDKIEQFNELALGGGFGKGVYDENGNWHGIAAFAFLDSHKYLEPVAGYVFLKVLHLNEKARIGGGYSILMTQRPDIFHGIPFPGVLPWLSFSYQRAALFATYIPGSRGAGNVLFLFAKWTF